MDPAEDLAGSVAAVLGLQLWLEHAGNDLTTESSQGVALEKNDEPVYPLASPSYHMATGTQLYLGPFLFGYVPGFSLDGSATDIIITFVLIAIGTWAYAWFLSGVWLGW